MIEIQCTSCQTRYRIDERILPEDTPTFKCSRCGHVFSAEPRQKSPRRTSAEGARGAAAAKPESRPAAGAAATPPSSAADAAADAEEPTTTSTAKESAPAEPRQAPPAADAAPAAQTPRPSQAGVAGRGAASEPPVAEPPRAPEQQPQPEAPAPARHDTKEFLQRRFADIQDNEADTPGENLAFDFNEEQQPPDSSAHSYPEEKWEVGETHVPPPPPPRPKRRIRISDMDDDSEVDSGLDQALRRNQASNQNAEQDFDRIRPEEVSAEAHRLEAELRSRSYKLHSAGYFIGLFVLVILGFGIVTIVIQSAPIASAGLLGALPLIGQGLEPPISPARRVALGQVQAQYAKIKDNQTALVISGTAENLTSASLGAVRIEAALTESSPEPLRTQAVYCGNSLSSKMIGEMTPHEIEFFEKLDAPKSFTLAPRAAAPFVIVFITPPAGAAHFQLRVVRADPAAASAPATEGG